MKKNYIKLKADCTRMSTLTFVAASNAEPDSKEQKTPVTNGGAARYVGGLNSDPTVIVFE